MDIFESFGIQPTLLVAQIVNFLIILFLLKKFFLGPILKVLEDRRKRIEESLKNADLVEERLQKTEEKSTEVIAQAQKNAQELISQAKQEAERIGSEAQAEARKRAEEIIAAARVQIEAQRLQMQKQLEKETLDLVVEVAKKVLGRNLKPEEKKQITKSALSELTKQIT